MKWSEHEKVRPVLFAPTVVHRGVGIVEERKGYTVRTSGDVDKLVPHEYECPVHGRFAVELPASDVPDELPCNLNSWTPAGTDLEYATEAACRTAIRDACGARDDDMRLETQRCAATSYWCGSSRVGIGISSGEVTG